MTKKNTKNKRGQGAWRRPRGAPRAVYAATRRQPWYRTKATKIVAAVVAVVFAGSLFGLVAFARNRASDLGARQKTLDDYTSRLRELVQTLQKPVGELPSTPPQKDADLKRLRAKIGRWIKAIQEANSSAVTLPPREETQLFQQAVGLYLSSANTYKTAGGLKNKQERETVMTTAAEIRARAEVLWQLGISMFDRARTRAELSPSRLQSPGVAAQPPVPQPPPAQGGEKKTTKKKTGDKK